MKKLGLVLLGAGIIAGSIFGGKMLYRELRIRNELKKAEVVVDALPEKKHIFSFERNNPLSPDLLHVIVVSFDEDAKQFLLRATREYLKHNPPPKNYDKEFFEKAVFWYVNATGQYIAPNYFSTDPWKDFSTNKDTLWVTEALRGEKKFTCSTLSSLLAAIENSFGSDASVLIIPPCGWTPPGRPLFLHAVTIIGDSIALDPDDLSKLRTEEIKYSLKAEKK